MAAKARRAAAAQAIGFLAAAGRFSTFLSVNASVFGLTC
jgi:hypothetical protein